MNEIIFIGRLTKEPELRFTAGSGKAVCTINLAVARPYAKDQTDFFRVIVWNKPAENAANYLVKGSLVAIRGRLQNNNYEKDGVKHYSTEIVASQVKFLDNRKNNQSPVDTDGFQVDEDDSDIPF